MQEEVVNLQFKYTEEEYVAATRLYMRRSKKFLFRLALCSVYIVACIFLLSWLEVAAELLILFVTASFIPPILFVLGFFVLPRQRFRRDPKFRDQYFLQFSDDGIQFKTAQIDAALQWSLYNQVWEDERFYILVYGEHMISVIPKRAFAGAAQESAFRQLLGRHLPAHFNAKQLAADAYVPPAEPPDWR
ncbi:MAG TPA: YcxB family protein [Pyrinomonadaceae bacterium]|nr:YcxB family protein [Pyrinomonadaceae bacterium]